MLRDTLQAMLARWVIPPGHRHKVKWDILLAVFIMYSVLTVPYRIGFSSDAEGAARVQYLRSHHPDAKCHGPN